MSQILLSAHSINKYYGSVKVLNNVNLELFKDEVLGLVGENGAGKSTLLKILSGAISVDSGTIQWEAEELSLRNTLDATRSGIGMVFQEQNLIPSIPVFENMFLGRNTNRVFTDNKTMIKACQKIFNQLSIDIDPTVITGELSLGMRQLLEIAKAFIQTAPKNGYRVILLDEPTEALSKAQIEVFYNIIRSHKKNTSFILVSHRLNETIDVCDRCIVMKDGEVVTAMNVSKSITEEKIHELMVGRQRDTAFYQENLQCEPGKKEILKVEGLSISGTFDNVSFSIREGEILGLAGMLGSGRSEVTRAIVGLNKASSKSVIFLNEEISKKNISYLIDKGMCYVPPERKEEGLILPHSVKWNLSLITPPVHFKGLMHLKREKKQAQNLVARLNIKTLDINTPTQRLSGGNQQKVVLGKWLAGQGIRLLVVEEPTRGIDVGAKQEIYKLFRELTSNKIAILISTENLMELIGLCNRIIVMKDGHITAEICASSDSKPHEVDIVKHMV